MNFKSLFQSKPPEVVVEAIYLAGRYLSRSLTWESFVRQLHAEHSTDTRLQAVALVEEISKSIEKESGKPIELLTENEKVEYVSDLDSFLWSTMTSKQDVHDIEEALEALRSTQ
jgi:hypothetical protein